MLIKIKKNQLANQNTLECRRLSIAGELFEWGQTGLFMFVMISFAMLCKFIKYFFV